MLLPVGLTNKVIEKPGWKELVHLQFKVKQNSSRRFQFRNLIPFREQLETRGAFSGGRSCVFRFSASHTGGLCCLKTHQLCVEHLCATLNNQKTNRIF